MINELNFSFLPRKCLNEIRGDHRGLLYIAYQRLLHKPFDCSISAAKFGQPHDFPVGGHAPVRAVERDNGGEMRAGGHQGLRVR